MDALLTPPTKSSTKLDTIASVQQPSRQLPRSPLAYQPVGLRVIFYRVVPSKVLEKNLCILTIMFSLLWTSLSEHRFVKNAVKC